MRMHISVLKEKGYKKNNLICSSIVISKKLSSFPVIQRSLRYRIAALQINLSHTVGNLCRARFSPFLEQKFRETR